METREFTFSEGTSDKFWKITLDGASHTVQYGRVGTAGQTQTKTFATDDEAKKSCDKLIAEKVKKGYAEAAGSTASATAAPAASVAASPKPAPAVAKTAKKAVTEEGPTAAPDTGLMDEPVRLLLDESDYRWATGRPWTAPKPRPATPAFTVEDGVARFLKVGTGQYAYNWKWGAAKIPVNMSREEAHFWLTALTSLGVDAGRGRDYLTPQQLGEKLVAMRFHGRLDAEVIAKGIRAAPSWRTPEVIVLPIVVLVGVEAVVDVVEALQDLQGAYQALVGGFRDYVLPYLTDEEREALRGRLRKVNGVSAVRGALQNVEPPHGILCLMAMVGGMSEELSGIVAKWPDGMGPGNRWRTENNPLLVVLGLEDPDRIAAEARRLEALPVSPTQMRALLAATEFRALDVARDAVLAEDRKTECEALLRAFVRAESPEVAPHMLDLMREAKSPRPAREWLEAHPVHAAEGLLPLAAGPGGGKRAEAAVEFLRTLKKQGREAMLRAKAEKLPPDALEKVRELVLEWSEPEYTPLTDETAPGWLREALAAAASTGVAAGDVGRATVLPPVLVPRTEGGGEPRRLSDTQVGALLTALRRSTLEKPDPLVTALRENGDRRSLEAFSWKLFEQWMGDGAPSKARWEMQATGLLGGDQTALKLAPLVKVWPGESQHQRAVFGLECLRTIGTDTALMQINGIAQKAAFKGLKTKAGECMEAIAQARNLSREELEDRIVPDCDLDERGTRVFDFGTRKFTFVLSPEMKPVVKDEAGARRPDLPKPNTKDDPEQAEAAVAAWKILKKQIADVVKIQTTRLEQAMVTGRRWQPEAFDLLLIKHPLMTNLVRLLVWGAYGADGALRGTFRVTEDQSLADASDDTYELPAETASVGIVHPLQVGEADRNAWGEVLSDYEIVPPFAQMGRPLFGLEAGEAETNLITRFKDVKIPGATLCFGLEKMGWLRGAAQDAGGFYEHIKQFHSAGISACVVYEEGLYMGGGPAEWEDQRITEVYFVPRVYNPRSYADYPDHKNALVLGTVDPIAVSEVLNEVYQIVAKGTKQ